MKELKDIPGYQGIYAATKDGQIWSYKTNKFLNQHEGNNYLFVHLITDKDRRVGVHRLVALAWIPNPENKLTVDHIDRNPKNNKVENLRWATQLEQAKNKTIDKEKLKEAGLKGAKKVSKPVEMRDLINHNILLDTFNSSREAAIKMFNDPSKNSLINRYANGKKKSAYGYFWSFVGEYNNN